MTVTTGARSERAITRRPWSPRRFVAAGEGLLWTQYARTYDALQRLTGYGEMLDLVADAAGPLAGRRVVEVGCGTGNVLARLRDAGAGRLLGVDSSAAMLDRARGKLAQGLASGRVIVARGDAVAALGELSPRSVDVLVACNVLYALPDRPAFWSAADRVLADGGRVVVSNPDRQGFAPVARQQWRSRGPAGFADRRLLAVAALNVAIDVLAVGGRYTFLPWSALAAEAERAGLARAVVHGRCYGGPDSGINVVGVLTRT